MIHNIGGINGLFFLGMSEKQLHSRQTGKEDGYFTGIQACVYEQDMCGMQAEPK
jgi:hypothetical protein